jgi:hypothetical protein
MDAFRTVMSKIVAKTGLVEHYNFTFYKVLERLWSLPFACNNPNVNVRYKMEVDMNIEDAAARLISADFSGITFDYGDLSLYSQQWDMFTEIDLAYQAIKDSQHVYNDCITIFGASKLLKRMDRIETMKYFRKSEYFGLFEDEAIYNTIIAKAVGDLAADASPVAFVSNRVITFRQYFGFHSYALYNPVAPMYVDEPYDYISSVVVDVTTAAGKPQWDADGIVYNQNVVNYLVNDEGLVKLRSLNAPIKHLLGINGLLIMPVVLKRSKDKQEYLTYREVDTMVKNGVLTIPQYEHHKKSQNPFYDEEAMPVMGILGKTWIIFNDSDPTKSGFLRQQIDLYKKLIFYKIPDRVARIGSAGDRDGK